MDLNQKVRSLVAMCLSMGVDDVKDDSHFVDDLGGDSLDAVEVIMAVEEEFQVEIPDYEEENLTTPAKVADWLRKHGVSG